VQASQIMTVAPVNPDSCTASARGNKENFKLLQLPPNKPRVAQMLFTIFYKGP
jgi:hypothetical protein